MEKKLTYVIISTTLCLAIGYLSAFVVQSSVTDWYTTILKKPNFTPTNAMFTAIWTALYVMMGIAAGWVWSKGVYHKWVKTALYHFVLQLLLNALWTIVFFGLKEPFWAMLVIIALIIVLWFTIKWFRVVSKLSALLMVPYFLWVCFAAVLNFKIWQLNR